MAAFDQDGAGPAAGALYAGGVFTTAWGEPASRIAKWNGWDWLPVGGGVQSGSEVNALVTYDDGAGSALYAGGSFTAIGGASASSVARWTGVTWEPLGAGLPATVVRALAVLDDGSGPALYAAGFSAPEFATSRSGATPTVVHRWDGASWHAIPGTFDGPVLGLLGFDDDGDGVASLFACGAFTSIGGSPFDHVAKWTGSSWLPLGAGLDAPGHAMTVFDDGSGARLFVGGAFTNASGVAANRIAAWNGSSWSGLGSGTDGEIFALSQVDDGGGGGLQLVAGGAFAHAGGSPISGIARWNGVQWSGFGAGGSGVEALATWQPIGLDRSHLFAGGSFTTIGGSPSARIGEWLGSDCDKQNLLNDEIEPPSTLAPPCGTTLSCGSSPVFGDPYTYIPTEDTPIKYVQLNFHVFNRTNGSGNYPDSPAGLAALNQLVDIVNWTYRQGGCTPSDPCSPPTAPHDSRIRFCLSNVYHYNNTQLWNSNVASELQEVAFAAHASTREYLNVYFVGAPGNAGQSGDATGPSSDRAYDQSVRMYGQTDQVLPSGADTFAHELGHCLGLKHPYNSECSVAACDYLTDLFCHASAPCPHVVNWSGDPFSSPTDDLTNNLMGGNREACHFTNIQMGRAHRALSTTSMQKYVKEPDCVPPPLNLALWTTLDEPNGAIAHNAAGGNHGQHVNGPTIGPGMVGRALQFDGASGQHVRVASYPAINFADGDLSLCAWVKRFGSGRQVIAEKRLESAGSIRGYSLFVDSHDEYGDVLRFQLADGTANDYGGNFTTDMPADGLWRHVAVTVRRNDPLGGTFYIDGVPQPVRFPTNSHNGSLGSNAPLTIGGRGATDSWNGSIDDVQVVRRVLTPDEIAAYYAAGPSGNCSAYCILPASRSFCANQSSITVKAKICNAEPVPQTYMYWFRGLELDPDSGWSIDGPDTFTPCSAMITVPGGTCVPLSVQIQRPAGMTAASLAGGYELNVQSLGTELVTKFSCRGEVRDRRDLCVLLPSGVVIPVGVTNWYVTAALTNTSVGQITESYEWIVMDDHSMLADTTAVSLNGLSPGTPAVGLLSLAPGASTELDVAVQFLDYQPLRSFSLLLRADMDRDGLPEPLASVPIATFVEGDESPGIAFCSATASACPCANGGADESGCGNSAFPSGARLVATGSASVSDDGIAITASNMPNGISLLLQATAQTSVPFGDGLRCVSGSIVRFPPRPNVAHSNSYPAAGDPPISETGGVPAAGGTRYYQVWYRDAASYCTSAAFNLTNGYGIVWYP